MTMTASKPPTTEARTAYMILETVRDKNGEFIVCIAKEGEKGYYRTDWHWGTDLKLAEACAEEKNAMLGLTKEDAINIILSTM